MNSEEGSCQGGIETMSFANQLKEMRMLGLWGNSWRETDVQGVSVLGEGLGFLGAATEGRTQDEG